MAARVLALVPHVPRAKRDVLAVMTATRKFSRLAEAFAGLRSLMESPRYQEMSRVVLVVSTQPEEGKTITCCNVSLAYALTGQRTLLVDFDMRRPRLAHVFGLRSTNPPSLMHVLNENDPSLFGTLPVSSGYPSLDIVTSRSTTQISPASIMGSGIVPQFIKWARENYERVIIDSPPFGLVSDSVVLATLADSVVMVCRPDLSRYRAMRHAIRYLSSAGATVMGVVVNDVDFGRSSYFSNYDYHTYGYSYTYKYGKYGRYYTRLAEDRETPSTPSGAAAPTPDEAAAAASARPTESVLDVDDDE
jgi:capsular exopolysaccharide synthesis family protein